MNSWVWPAAAIAAGFFIPLLQALRLSALGSDHAVHVFLINVIRESGFRLFEIVPRIVNRSYCGAYPLFLHWVLALGGPRVVPAASLFMNAVLNAALVAMTYLVLDRSAIAGGVPAGPVALALALLPQFYHALSARNFGISARPLGLLLFASVGLLAVAADTGAAWPLIVGIGVAYLLWGASTFGLQTLLFVSALMGLLFGHWPLAAMTAAGGAVFVVLHRRYALSYLRHTARFSATYARELAALFILQRRYSVWRDLVWDIWCNLRRMRTLDALRYAYENPVVIAVALNVVTILAATSLVVRGDAMKGLLLFAAQLSAVALVLFVATSFRRTRFLGEPERYLEMAAPFATIAGIAFLQAAGGDAAVTALLAYFAVVTLGQLGLAGVVKRAARDRARDVTQIREAIEAHCPAGATVRLAANNDETQKYFMTLPWSFVRYWSYEEPFAGFRVRNAFDPFPVLRTAAVEAAIRDYGANYCLMEGADGAPRLFTDDADWRARLSVLAEGPTYCLYAIGPATA